MVAAREDRPFLSGRNGMKGSEMVFLLRMGFWFSLVLLALPLGASQLGGRQVGPLDALAAARDAVGDLAGLCERKPDVCETGRSAVQTIGARAREGSRIAFTLLDERFGEAPAADAAVTTGATRATGAEPPVPVPLKRP